LFSKRGVGKTDISIQAIKECGYKVSYLNLSVVERQDLQGFPNINSPGDTIEFKSPHFLPKLKGKADTVILFDEVDKASPDTLAPLLEILLYKTINGQPINAVACVLTGNLPEERTYSNQISSALLDRGAKYIIDFDFNRWCEWGRSNKINDLIMGFLRSNPELCSSKTKDESYAQPSPRGWSLASRALDKAKDFKVVDLDSITHIIAGYVGMDAGTRFRSWFEYYRRFEPVIHTLIEKRMGTIDFEELIATERLIFVISACHYAKQKTIDNKSKNFKYLENLCYFFKKYKIDLEMQMLGLMNSFDFEIIKKHQLYSCKVFLDLFTELSNEINAKK
jgi:hypothetical protein